MRSPKPTGKPEIIQLAAASKIIRVEKIELPCGHGLIRQFPAIAENVAFQKQSNLYVGHRAPEAVAAVFNGDECRFDADFF